MVTPPPPPTHHEPEWTRPRLVLLSRHAAASAVTPDEALDSLLNLPPASSGTRRRWTEAELQLLRNPRNKPRDIARQLHRTETSVSARRSQLAREENIPALQNRRRK